MFLFNPMYLFGLVIMLPGVYFTWKGITRFIQRHPRLPDKNPGLHAAYVVAIMLAIAACPLLFPGNLRYLAGISYVIFVLVGVKHVYLWFQAAKKAEEDSSGDGEQPATTGRRIGTGGRRVVTDENPAPAPKPTPAPTPVEDKTAPAPAPKADEPAPTPPAPPKPKGPSLEDLIDSN